MVEEKGGSLPRGFSEAGIFTNDQRRVINAMLHGFIGNARIAEETGMKESMVYDAKKFMVEHVDEGIGTIRMAKVVTLAVLNDEIDTEHLEREPSRPFTAREYKMLVFMALGLNKGQMETRIWASDLDSEKAQILANLNTISEIVAVAWIARRIRKEYGNISISFN